MAFSIKRTGRALFNFEEDSSNNTFRCIDGLKGLATVPLFLSLKLLTFGHLPFTNKAQLTKVIQWQVTVTPHYSLQSIQPASNRFVNSFSPESIPLY